MSLHEVGHLIIICLLAFIIFKQYRLERNVIKRRREFVNEMVVQEIKMRDTDQQVNDMVAKLNNATANAHELVEEMKRLGASTSQESSVLESPLQGRSDSERGPAARIH